MKRKFILAIPATGLMAASLAGAGTWTATVLYPLNLPSGFTSLTPGGNAQTAMSGQAVGSGSNSSGNDNALLWPGSSTAVNLNPSTLDGGITNSYAYATNGTQQVGYGFGTGTSSNSHAILWSGTVASAVDLNPTNLTGISNSFAYATNGTLQVGFGYGAGTSNNNNALLWSGSAGSAINLNPTNLTGITNSFANGVSATQQVGYGYGTGTSGNSHALLWTGSASSTVDLNPTSLTGITISSANGAAATQQVGYGAGTGTSGNDHAMLWTGTAASAVDLNPTNLSTITSSIAYATNGSQQVGYGFGDGTSDNAHALAWSSTANSAVDLQLSLPSPNKWVYSDAYSLDSAGNAYGLAYGTYGGITALYAVQWSSISNLTWNNSGGASPSDGQIWDANNNNNWNNGSTAGVYTDSANVTFNDVNNGNYAVTLNTTVSPGSVIVNNSLGDYTISGSGTIAGTASLAKSGTGTLTLSTPNSYTGGTIVSAGVLVIAPTSSTTSALPNGPVTISGSGILQLATNVTLGSQSSPTPASNVNITSLSITGSGQLDINNNHIIINYGSGADPIASITALIMSGYASGAWTGAGIMSTAAQTNGGSYGIGYADSADPGNPAGLASGQIEVMYTLLGDANLDGSVNGSDFAILATNFNKAVSGWDQGDFNYDGAANGADFALLASNFNKGASQAADLAAVDAFASANGLLTSVPEPASLGLLLVGSTGLLARRRRNR